MKQTDAFSAFPIDACFFFLPLRSSSSVFRGFALFLLRKERLGGSIRGVRAARVVVVPHAEAAQAQVQKKHGEYGYDHQRDDRDQDRDEVHAHDPRGDPKLFVRERRLVAVARARERKETSVVTVVAMVTVVTRPQASARHGRERDVFRWCERHVP